MVSANLSPKTASISSSLQRRTHQQGSKPASERSNLRFAFGLGIEEVEDDDVDAIYIHVSAFIRRTCTKVGRLTTYDEDEEIPPAYSRDCKGRDLHQYNDDDVEGSIALLFDQLAVSLACSSIGLHN